MLTENHMEECFRWYGPSDPVSLQYIIQAGATAVFTSLHHIPYGEVWPREEIRKRLDILSEAGLRWAAVESVPIHEDIKTRTGAYKRYIENYKTCIRNLAAEGVEVVIYNFMPVLDWVRTDLRHKLEDGTECLHFDPVRFAAFEIYLLKRKGAEKDYTADQLRKAEAFWNSLDEPARKDFEYSLIDVFPGCKMGYTAQDINKMLSAYQGIDKAKLKEHYKLFLQEIVPVAEEVGVRLAVHPDDPPFSIMGLPRIVSCEKDLEDILAMVDSPANGLCLCSGSLSPRAENDIPGIIGRLGSRINALHLRSTQRHEDGSFYEANHLEGSIDMYAIVKAVLIEQQKRKDDGRADWQLSFRPDHGHTMMDDLAKPPTPNPGYSCIGRMRGLAELRGLQLGIARSLQSQAARTEQAAEGLLTPCCSL